MDPNLLHLAVAAGLTLVCVAITALIWSRAQVKTVFWWIGLTLVPMALYLAGLGPAVVGAYETLRLWWGTLTFTPVVITGLVLAGVSAFLILGSRLIPSESYADRRAERKAAKAAPSAPTTTQRTRAAVAQKVTPPVAQTPPKATDDDDEFDDIADILRQRGIN
ncbi:MAG: hypothetical protein ACK5LN_04225 [Propioniciclava sp.]